MVGRTISHYQILEKLGEGGMGVVYKARDSHLKRFVALKVLPPEKVADPERKHRFVQEARSASALNHPNIVTVYDIDQAEGVDFIAMEYVEGKTLDELIGRKGLKLNEALKCGVQVADALAKAHAAGIVHRDLKPGNVMLTAEGRVKVLDFGLAKLTEPASVSSEDSTLNEQPSTETGLIVGTVSYMSPEQAEGKKVDARGDIFSFGSLLYEMLTGRRPFRRDTLALTLAAILHLEPPPLPAGIPAELGRIITRCLRKDPAHRFQHMDDLKVALEEVKEESESGLLSAAPPPRQRRRALLWAGCALAIALATGSAAWFLSHPAPQAPATVAVLAARAGIEWGPALSSDGKQIAFVWNGGQGDNNDIYVQLVDEATPRRLTTDPRLDYSPAWSPDALRIAFLRESRASTDILIVPAGGGGSERKLHTSAAACDIGIQEMARQFCGISWSPDGRFISFVDKESPKAPNSIFFLDVETMQKRKVTSPPADWFGDGLSVFSPDGLSLAFVRTPSPIPSEIYVLPLSRSGEPRRPPRRITPIDDSAIFGLDWTRDSRELVFASARRGVPALWRVAASGGEPRRLMVGGDSSHWPSLARNGDRLAYTRVTDDWNIWRVAASGRGDASSAVSPVRITQSPLWDMGPVLSPDDSKVLYNSFYSGSMQVWVCGIDGSEPRRLTDLKRHAMWPQWSPDGRQIAVVALAGTDLTLYVIAAEGGAALQLPTGGMSVRLPSWSRDGTQIYFVSNRGPEYALWRVPVRGGAPVLFAPGGQGPIAESVDGRYVFYSGPDSHIWKMPAGGGAAVPVLKVGGRALWTISATGIYVLDPDAEGGAAIRFFAFLRPTSGEVSRTPSNEAVKLPGDPDTYYSGLTVAIAVSSDGRWVFYERHDRKDGDIMLVENFR